MHACRSTLEDPTAEEQGCFAEVFQQILKEESERRRQGPAAAVAAAADASPAPPPPAAAPPPPVAPPVPAAPAASLELSSLTIGAAVKRWLDYKAVTHADETKSYYTDRLPTLLRLVGHVLVSAWGHDDVMAYAKQRVEEGHVKPTTAKRELDMIKGALKMLRRSSKALAKQLDDPATYWPELKAPVAARKEYLRRSELPRLLAALTLPYQRDWLLWAVYTGGRRSELHRLRWDDLDTESGRIHIRGTKTQKSDRWVPLHHELVRWCVEKQSERQRSGPILVRWGNVNRDLELACQRAGIRKLTPNSLRRTFGSWLRQAGVPDSHIADLMGHEKPDMVAQVYGQLTEDQARDAISEL